MATYQKGVLGQFNGKVGTVIGSSWKGIAYMRSLPKKSSKPATDAQKEVRIKFSLITAFFKPISALIKKGYQSTTGNLTPVNAAVSYHLKNAITGSFPDFTVDYTKVLFSSGTLLGPKTASVTAGESLALNFAWANNANEGNAKAEDGVSILLYGEATKEYVVYENAAQRADATVALNAPSHMADATLHCWMGNVSEDGKMVSTSIYLGTVVPIED